MRFLIDENLTPLVADELVRQGHDVRVISRSLEQGQSDSAVWRLAAAEERVVITRDLDFPLAELPRPPGLVLLRLPNWFTRREIPGYVVREIASYGPENLLDKIIVLAPGREPRTRDFDA